MSERTEKVTEVAERMKELYGVDIMPKVGKQDKNSSKKLLDYSNIK